MRRKTFSLLQQHNLTFTRQDIWQSMPVDLRQECRNLCEQMLRDALQAEQQMTSEVYRDREVSPRAL